MDSSDSTTSSGSTSNNKKPSPDAPNEVRRRLKAGKGTVDKTYIQMGRDLYLAYHRRLYQTWGYDTFTDYVEKEVGIAKTRAERLRRIWTKYIKKLKVSPKELEGVGFTNAFTMMPVVDSGNVHEWMDKAKSSSWRDLDLAVQVARSPSPAAVAALAGAGAAVKTGDKIADTGMAFHDDDEAPDELKPGDLRRPWTFRMYPSQYKVVDAAVSEARRTKPDEMAENEALAHVATEFLAARMSKEESPLVRLKFLMTTMEQVYGGKFVWIKNDAAAAFLTDSMESRPDLFDDVPATEEEA